MRHAGVVKALKRPKWTGGRRLDWLRSGDAFRLLEPAGATDKRLGAPMTFLLYTGPRLSEALRLTWADIDLGSATALLRQTKNGEPIVVHLPPWPRSRILARTSGEFLASPNARGSTGLLDKAEMLSGVSPSGRRWLHSTCCVILDAIAGGVYSPTQTPPPSLRPAYGSPGNAASVYEHLDLSAESRKSDLFPTPKAKLERGG